jgi:hypothetical protein
MKFPTATQTMIGLALVSGMGLAAGCGNDPQRVTKTTTTEQTTAVPPPMPSSTSTTTVERTQQ